MADGGSTLQASRWLVPTLAVSLALLGALAAGWFGMLWAMSVDGVSADDQTPGGSLLAIGLMTWSITVACAIGLLAFSWSWSRKRRAMLAVMAGLTPCAATLFALPVIWNA